MSASQRSWDLKVQRAEQHLNEIKAAMAAYASRNPYRAVRFVNRMGSGTSGSTGWR